MRAIVSTFVALAAYSSSALAADTIPCRTPNGSMPAIDSRLPMKPGDAPRMHCEMHTGILHTTEGPREQKYWQFVMKDSDGRYVVGRDGGIPISPTAEETFSGSGKYLIGRPSPDRLVREADLPANRNRIDPSRSLLR